MRNQNEKSNMKKAFTLIQLLVVIAIVAILAVFVSGLVGGCSGKGFVTFPFGPEENLTVTVKRLYVDYDGEFSSYMVGTDIGVFEVENSALLGIYNADETYSFLEEGKSYYIITKGEQVTNMFVKRYPVIINAVSADLE